MAEATVSSGAVRGIEGGFSATELPKSRERVALKASSSFEAFRSTIP